MKNRLFAAVLAAAAAILVYQLFAPPIVGLADQGDFVRTIGRFGWGPQHKGSLLYRYVEPKYVPDPQYRGRAWEHANTEYLFVSAALLLNRLVSKDGALDITVMGLVHLLAFLAAFARLLWVTRHFRKYALVWIVALIALTDAGYAVYWNSFYCEPASCIFFLLLLAEAVELARTGQIANIAAIVRWSLWASLWILAKAQNAPLGLIVGLYTLWLAFGSASRRLRTAVVVGGCAILGCAAFDVIALPPVPHLANTYGMVFSGILPESKDPAADLRALGLDPQLASYSGSGAWTPGTPFHSLAEEGVLQRRVTTFSILRFYLLRPARLWRRLHGALPSITFLRWNWYGNFEPSAGLPAAAQSRAFNMWSFFHERVLPPFSKWIVFALAGFPLFAAWRWHRTPDPLARRRLELTAILALCALAALVTAVFGDAFDLIKHLFLFNLLLDVCLVGGAAALWKMAGWTPPVHLRSPAALFGGIFLVLLIAYFPAIHGYYLHTDDYFVSRWCGVPYEDLLNVQLLVGRPLAGMVFWTYGLARSMSAINVLRALSVLNLAAAGFLVYRYLRKELSNTPAALAAAVGLFTTPTFTTAVGYVTTGTFALAVTVSAAAFVLASECPSRRGAAVAAAGLMIAALSLYQPGALFYLSLVAVSIFLADPSTFWREQVHRLARHAAIVGSACAVYYLAWRIWLYAIHAPVGGKYDGRRFVGDVYERLKWFVRTPLVETANLWFVQPKMVWAIVAGCVILAALALERRAMPGKIVLLAAILPMTYGISLASYMPSPEYRTYTALEGAIALLFFLSLWRILSAARRWLPQRAAEIAMAAAAFCGLCAANVTVRRYFTVPDSTEFRYVKDQIDHYRRTAGADFAAIDIIVRPDPVAPVQRNEMGEPSLRHGPNLHPIVRAALRELDIARDVPVYQTLPNDPSTWVLWGDHLHGILGDYFTSPPRPEKAVIIDATKIRQAAP